MTEIRLSRSGYTSLPLSHGRVQAQAPQTFPAWSALRWTLFAPFVLAGNIVVAMFAWFIVDMILN
jgi:hypothetical protein